MTVDLPDQKGRLEILKVHSRNKKLADDVDLQVGCCTFSTLPNKCFEAEDVECPTRWYRQTSNTYVNSLVHQISYIISLLRLFQPYVSLLRLFQPYDVDLQEVAMRTPGFAGANLMNLLNEAAILAGRRGLKVGHALEQCCACVSCSLAL